MLTHVLTAGVFLTAAFVAVAQRAEAAPVFCTTSVQTVVPAHEHAESDTTYRVVIRGFGKLVTSARVALYDGTSKYTVDVPLERIDQKDDPAVGQLTTYRPLAVHFATPIGLHAVWLDTIASAGITYECLPGAAIVSFESGARSEEDHVGTQRAIDVNISEKPMPMPRPSTCKKRVEMVHADAVVSTDDPQPEGHGDIDVIVVVGIAPDGQLVYSEVRRSSGNFVFDNAAIHAAKLSRYEPTKVDCIPFAGTYIFRATYLAL